jgi:polyketide cyclase/dehydrase/lipid transport protein
MKSTVTIEINLPQAQVAELFSNPRHTTRWMHDVDRVEVVSGELGAPGSQYRLVPKKGNMVFVATVLARDLPKQSRLRLDASNVVVSVTGTFQSLSPKKTLLVSSEVFSFEGVIPAIFGFLAQGAIRKAHRRHMEVFKTFAETQHSGVSA